MRLFRLRKKYSLFRLGSLIDPDELLLSYECGSFDNTEWRPCVEHFLSELASQGHEVVALPSPAFEKGEDFVEISYLLDGVKTTFSSDFLLSLIVITSEDQRVLRRVWDDIGGRVGWAT
jgi:hypothetical protein